MQMSCLVQSRSLSSISLQSAWLRLIRRELRRFAELTCMMSTFMKAPLMSRTLSLKLLLASFLMPHATTLLQPSKEITQGKDLGKVGSV